MAELMRAKEVAEVLGTSVRAVYVAADSGRLPCVRLLGTMCRWHPLIVEAAARGASEDTLRAVDKAIARGDDESAIRAIWLAEAS